MGSASTGTPTRSAPSFRRSGAWVLDSQNPRNATRTLFLDFGQPVAGSGPNGGDPIAVPSALYKVHAISKCNLYDNSMWTLAPGATMACPLHIAFSYGGVQLRRADEPVSDRRIRTALRKRSGRP